MKVNKQLSVILVLAISLMACGTPVDKLAGKNLKQQDKLAQEGKLGSLGKVGISRKNFAYYNMDGRVYEFDDVKDMPASLREEIIRRELLRREFVRRGYEEGVFNDAEAEAYIWPRMEKILEEYYHYKKLDYPRILSANKIRFSGNKAIEKFYEKNQAAFAREKLSVDDIKIQIGKKVQMLTEKEYEEKKIKAIQDLMQREKIEILR